MPATSKKQQRYFGMVHAGKIPKPKGMKKKDVLKFAKTKHKNLKEIKDLSFIDFLIENNI